MGWRYASIVGILFTGIGIFRLIQGTRPVSAIVYLMIGIILIAIAFLLKMK